MGGINTIMDSENIQVMLNMLNKYGEKQMIIAIEELSELQKEICKKLRNPDSSDDNILEELADVYIMLTQICIYYNLDITKVEEIMKEKLKRTEERYL